MIPYFQYNMIILGPITLQVWGLFVATGLLAGVWLADRLAKKYVLSSALVFDLIFWIMAGGLVGARAFHVLFYALDYYMQNPAEIYRFWHGGASSLGGVAGAALAMGIFAFARGLKWRNLSPYFDICALGLWLAWGIGRIGCFIIHDHPGQLTDFWGAVAFPDGARYDLGLYESLFAFALFAMFSVLFRRLVQKRWGLVAAYSGLVYAAGRFGLDFLRATDVINADPRFWALTPAQWGMAGVVAVLTFALVRGKMRGHSSAKWHNGEVA